MKLNKCYICGKFKYTPYNVLDENSEPQNVCVDCVSEPPIEQLVEDFVVGVDPEEFVSEHELDLTDIKTPEQLLDFIMGVTPNTSMHQQVESYEGPCECGMTLKEISERGKLGCPNCYNHFFDYLSKVISSYHYSEKHVGKEPACCMKVMDFKEKEKLLKLQLAKAVELEEYEKAAEIKKQLDDLEN